MNEDILDGYGNPFPLEAQERHLLAVLAAPLYLPPEESSKEQIQIEWKDKPAGYYNKGSGV